MDIKRSGSQPSGKGPAEYFTGTVRVVEKVSDEQYEARTLALDEPAPAGRER